MAQGTADRRRADGEALKARRIEAGYTQEEFARLLQTTPTTVARWERGEREINHGWVELAFEVIQLRGADHEGAPESRRGPRAPNRGTEVTPTP